MFLQQTGPALDEQVRPSYLLCAQHCDCSSAPSSNIFSTTPRLLLAGSSCSQRQERQNSPFYTRSTQDSRTHGTPHLSSHDQMTRQVLGPNTHRFPAAPWRHSDVCPTSARASPALQASSGVGAWMNFCSFIREFFHEPYLQIKIAKFGTGRLRLDWPNWIWGEMAACHGGSHSERSRAPAAALPLGRPRPGSR